MPAEEAMQRLAEKGFEGHVEYRPDEKPVGRVVEQWPRAFAVAPRDASIVLFVGGAEGAK
jgi:beta-lactam-binding protein with PASTA domain